MLRMINMTEHCSVDYIATLYKSILTYDQDCQIFSVQNVSDDADSESAVFISPIFAYFRRVSA